MGDVPLGPKFRAGEFKDTPPRLQGGGQQKTPGSDSRGLRVGDVTSGRGGSYCPAALLERSGNCFCSCSRWMMMVGLTRISSTASSLAIERLVNSRLRNGIFERTGTPISFSTSPAR